ncbi:MAG: magnesium/cobalt transporter CorA [Bacteroidota bacterium]
MAKRNKKNPFKPGEPPGTLTYFGKETLRDTKVTLTQYNEQAHTITKLTTITECTMLPTSSMIQWINVDGISNTEVITTIGQAFGLHSLLLEDVMNTEQKPKMETYENNIFVVMKMLDYNSRTRQIETEHVSLVLGPSYVISFQEEREGDAFDPVRARLNNSTGRTRRSGADYLFYALIDNIIDNYFVVLESIGEKVEVLEEEIINQSTSKSLKKLYSQKRELIFLRKSIWPVREIISGLVREETELIRAETHIYLRDVYDHTIQIIDTAESYRDLMASLLDIYLSAISNRMNNVMKVLTIVSTIFMPLSFIVGVYGMNFDNMPELHWKYGYFGVWGVIIAVSFSMLAFFQRKRWL